MTFEELIVKIKSSTHFHQTQDDIVEFIDRLSALPDRELEETVFRLSEYIAKNYPAEESSSESEMSADESAPDKARNFIDGLIGYDLESETAQSPNETIMPLIMELKSLIRQSAGLDCFAENTEDQMCRYAKNSIKSNFFSPVSELLQRRIELQNNTLSWNKNTDSADELIRSGLHLKQSEESSYLQKKFFSVKKNTMLRLKMTELELIKTSVEFLQSSTFTPGEVTGFFLENELNEITGTVSEGKANLEKLKEFSRRQNSENGMESAKKYAETLPRGFLRDGLLTAAGMDAYDAERILEQKIRLHQQKLQTETEMMERGWGLIFEGAETAAVAEMLSTYVQTYPDLVSRMNFFLAMNARAKREGLLGITDEKMENHYNRHEPLDHSSDRLASLLCFPNAFASDYFTAHRIFLKSAGSSIIEKERLSADFIKEAILLLQQGYPIETVQTFSSLYFFSEEQTAGLNRLKDNIIEFHLLVQTSGRFPAEKISFPEFPELNLIIEMFLDGTHDKFIHSALNLMTEIQTASLSLCAEYLEELFFASAEKQSRLNEFFKHLKESPKDMFSDYNRLLNQVSEFNSSGWPKSIERSHFSEYMEYSFNMKRRGYAYSFEEARNALVQSFEDSPEDFYAAYPALNGDSSVSLNELFFSVIFSDLSEKELDRTLKFLPKKSRSRILENINTYAVNNAAREVFKGIFIYITRNSLKPLENHPLRIKRINDEAVEILAFYIVQKADDPESLESFLENFSDEKKEVQERVMQTLPPEISDKVETALRNIKDRNKG